MNVEFMYATAFAIGLGAKFIFVKIGDGVIAASESISEMLDGNSTISDINSTVIDANVSIDLNSTIDANVSMVVSVLNQLSLMV